MSQFRENLQTERRTEGWTKGRTDPIFRTLPAEARGPKKATVIIEIWLHTDTFNHDSFQ